MNTRGNNARGNQTPNAAVSKPTAEEKALLDHASKEYQRNPNAGRPWREAMDDLERKAKP